MHHDANLNERRVLSQMNPTRGGPGYVNRIADVGTQTYRAVRLSMRRSAASGVSLSANYTLSHCEADTEVGGRRGTGIPSGGGMGRRWWSTRSV